MVLQLCYGPKVLYDNTRCFVTILQLYEGNKASMTNHNVLLLFYNCMVVIKLVWHSTVLQMCDGHKVGMTKHGVLWRFYNYRVVLKLA